MGLTVSPHTGAFTYEIAIPWQNGSYTFVASNGDVLWKSDIGSPPAVVGSLLEPLDNDETYEGGVAVWTAENFTFSGSTSIYYLVYDSTLGGPFRKICRAEVSDAGAASKVVNTLTPVNNGEFVLQGPNQPPRWEYDGDFYDVSVNCVLSAALTPDWSAVITSSRFLESYALTETMNDSYRTVISEGLNASTETIVTDGLYYYLETSPGNWEAFASPAGLITAIWKGTYLGDPFIVVAGYYGIYTSRNGDPFVQRYAATANFSYYGLFVEDSTTFFIQQIAPQAKIFQTSAGFLFVPIPKCSWDPYEANDNVSDVATNGSFFYAADPETTWDHALILSSYYSPLNRSNAADYDFTILAAGYDTASDEVAAMVWAPCNSGTTTIPSSVGGASRWDGATTGRATICKTSGGFSFSRVYTFSDSGVNANPLGDDRFAYSGNNRGAISTPTPEATPDYVAPGTHQCLCMPDMNMYGYYTGNFKQWNFRFQTDVDNPDESESVIQVHNGGAGKYNPGAKPGFPGNAVPNTIVDDWNMFDFPSVFYDGTNLHFQSFGAGIGSLEYTTLGLVTGIVNFATHKIINPNTLATTTAAVSAYGGSWTWDSANSRYTIVGVDGTLRYSTAGGSISTPTVTVVGASISMTKYIGRFTVPSSRHVFLFNENPYVGRIVLLQDDLTTVVQDIEFGSIYGAAQTWALGTDDEGNSVLIMTMAQAIGAGRPVIISTDPDLAEPVIETVLGVEGVSDPLLWEPIVMKNGNALAREFDSIDLHITFSLDNGASWGNVWDQTDFETTYSVGFPFGNVFPT